MRIKLLLLAILLVLPTLSATAHTLDLRTNSYIALEPLLQDLESAAVIFIGEQHDDPAHHAGQIQLIRALVQRGNRVAVGVEMFRADGQPQLDAWSKGELDEEDFREIFEQHWSLWPVYRSIFLYARQQHLPMIGLNVDRELTRQISESGFDSLSPEQLKKLDGIACDVDQRYQNYLRRALGGHLQQEKFKFFCEAQMVWDAMMAKNLLAWHENHPGWLLVVLTGSGHAWKYGMPEQLRRRSELPFRVLLPEVPGRIDRRHTTAAEADYLLLGLDQGEIH